MTEKLSPPLPDRDDGWALTAPELETIVITWTEDPKDPIVPGVPLTMAVHAENETVPKSARAECLRWRMVLQRSILLMIAGQSVLLLMC